MRSERAIRKEEAGVTTRVLSHADGGRIQQVHYYQGRREVARESYNRRGTLLHRSGSIPDGIVEEFYPGGRVRREFSYLDCEPHGRAIEYYPDGGVHEENTFFRGRLHGPSITYRRDGTVWIDATYVEGRLHGLFATFHDNGAPEIRRTYRHGRLHGPYSIYDRYGLLLEEGTYHHGAKEGTFTFYYENGLPSRIERFEKGRLLSTREFDEDGRMITGQEEAGKQRG